MVDGLLHRPRDHSGSVSRDQAVVTLALILGDLEYVSLDAH
jgi:hypothetical protein